MERCLTINPYSIPTPPSVLWEWHLSSMCNGGRLPCMVIALDRGGHIFIFEIGSKGNN